MLPAKSHRRGLQATLAGVLFASVWLAGAVCAQAQFAPGDSVPSRIYFNSFPGLYDGNFRGALAVFTAESRAGIKTPTSQWIDSICYFTMAGECQYEMGQLSAALANYDAALKLFVAHSDWMMRIQFPPAIGPANRVAQATPWGQSKRGARIGQFPATFMMSQGQFNAAAVLQQGGVLQQPVIFPVLASEIVRCTCLAMRRRRELLGPLGPSDPLNGDLINVLTRRVGPANHWSEAWVQVQLGCAYAAAGSLPQANTALGRALLVSGEFDHPLTATALVESGRLALEAGDFAAALRFFEEASYASYTFGDLGILEESFRYGLLSHLLLNQKAPYPLLAPAMAWAKSEGYRHLQASLLVLAAENMAVLGDTAKASGYVSGARALVARSDLGSSQVAARMNHVAALAAYQSGNVEAGDRALSDALAFERGGGSLWNFQIGLADARYEEGNLSDRLGLALYEALLRDPLPGDWALRPLECLSVLTTPHGDAFEHWFEGALQSSKEQELALEIADRARRHRYLSTLPLGGRLLALRWILEAPPETIGHQAMLERQKLLVRYPQYKQLSERAAALRGNLAAGPLVPADAAARRDQAAALKALADTSQAQEVVLRQIAVARDPSDILFPPLRKTADVQNALEDGQVMLAFFETRSNLYAFLYSNERYATWRVAAPAQLYKQVSTLLRDMGNHDGNYELTGAQLGKSTWPASAAKTLDLLLARSNVTLAAEFDEIVIVPDGMLWYLPFEALTVGKPGEERLLISLARVRYAPTVGLAVPLAGVQKPKPNIGVVVGKLHPKDDDATATAAFEQLGRAVEGAVALPAALPVASSTYRVLLDELIVLDDVEPGGGVMDWSPLQIDRGKPGASLAHWGPLPFGGPTQLLLPGFHSAAESGARTASGAGNDLFLSLCGLMASGARTILISRWRTGGQTSFDLVREFAQELPHATPAAAWQRSVQIALDTPIDARFEPRVSSSVSADEPFKAGHPFFWSGFMLVDSGVASGRRPAAAFAPQAPAAPPAAAPPAAIQPIAKGAAPARPPRRPATKSPKSGRIKPAPSDPLPQ